MYLNSANELDRFKEDINLIEYLASNGYEIDINESSKNSIVMRSNDDKLVISTTKLGHGVYFNVYDDNDNGTIIDFVQYHQNKNLGEVRKELRPWLGQAPTERLSVVKYDKPSHLEPNRTRPLKSYLKAVNQYSDYLESRGIKKVQHDPRFSNIRTFSDGSVIFPHSDNDGFSGYELKGKDVTRFSSGGQKRLWKSLNYLDSKTIIITETALDALSYAELKYDNHAAYMSFAGTMSSSQEQYLSEVIRDANERDVTIVSACDNDIAGEKFTKFIESLAINFECDMPPVRGEDWNDVLRRM